MIRPIAVMGDPILKQIAREVTPEELQSDAIQGLIDDLIATVKRAGGAGLAAPQISESLRIVVVTDPMTVLVNPVLTPIGDVTDTSTEGCLSVPGMTGEVRRPQTVRVQALGRTGKVIDQTWTKFRAIVVQHEVDHLNGILYVERAICTTQASEAAAQQPALPPPTSGKQTIVVDSEKPVGGNRHVVWTFSSRGRVTGVRIQPGGAMVTAAYLSGVRLRAKGYKAGAAERFLLGDHGLVVAAGDQLRLELSIQNGKRRIVAEADVDWS
jgi:peptide deformylase